MSRFLLAAVMLFLPMSLRAQGDSAAPATSRTTRSGVFSGDQAAKGKDVFLGQCQSCHTAASMAAGDFVNNWNTKPLADLFTYLVENMPESEPGALSKAQYAQVVAYILQLNQMPAGELELAAEADSLKDIRIDIAAAPLPSTLSWLATSVSRRTTLHAARR